LWIRLVHRRWGGGTYNLYVAFPVDESTNFNPPEPITPNFPNSTSNAPKYFFILRGQSFAIPTFFTIFKFSTSFFDFFDSSWDFLLESLDSIAWMCQTVEKNLIQTNQSWKKQLGPENGKKMDIYLDSKISSVTHTFHEKSAKKVAFAWKKIFIKCVSFNMYNHHLWHILKNTH